MNINGGVVELAGVLRVYDTAGTIVALNSGTLTAASLDVSGNNSRFQWGGGTLNLHAGSVAVRPTGLLGADVTLGSDKSLLLGVDLTVGDGAVGELTSLGATVRANTVGVGMNSAHGTMTQYAGQITAGLLAIGTNGGTGTVTIDGGTVEVFGFTQVANNASRLFLNGGSLKTSSLNLGGVASRFNWTGGALELTNSDFDVQAGGPIGTGLTLTTDKSLAVSGTSKTLTVGNTAGGTLHVRAGGVLHASNLRLANAAGVAGSLYVDGVGSGVNTGLLEVASKGAGSLSVEDGATVTVRRILVGRDEGSSGTIDVGFTGTQSATLTSDSVVLGWEIGSTGLLRIGSHGVVEAANGLSVYAEGSRLEVAGGSLSGKFVDAGYGTTVHLSQGATIKTTGFYVSGAFALGSGGMVLEINSSDEPQMGFGSITSAITEAPGQVGSLTKTGDGYLILSGANSYSGPTTVLNGSIYFYDNAALAILSNTGGLDLTGGSASFVALASTGIARQIHDIVRAGYANGFAMGHIRATDLADGLVLGSYGQTSVENGIAKSFIQVRATITGDADLNGTVDFNDFLLLQNGFGSTDSSFGQGDFNFDGETNFNDFLLLQNNFGQHLPGVVAPAPLTAAQAAAMTAFAQGIATVPEPAVLGLAVCGFGLIRRTRRSPAA